MPQIGGLELARKLLALRPEIKVLYVSGYSENDMNEQGILPSELEFLEKPFTPQALTRKVRDVLKPASMGDSSGLGHDSTVGVRRPMTGAGTGNARADAEFAGVSPDGSVPSTDV